MADPFDILANTGPMPSPPGGALQQQSSPRPSWPGMNHPAASSTASSAPMVQQHQQSLYAPPAAGGSGFYQQQNIMQMGRANSAAPPPAPLGSGLGYAMYAGAGQHHQHQHQQHQHQHQQYQQHQQMGGVAMAASWGGMSSPVVPTPPSAAGAGAVGPFPSSAAGWNPVYGQAAPNTIPAATPQAPMQINTTGAANGRVGGPGATTGGGAEWIPPAEQLQAYDSMYRTASSGCPVPGTVSGRAAVQFFSRSGLSKDVLKTIWSLCDPCLTGSIDRPGFFAAMRLITLAQQQLQPRPPSSSPGPSPALTPQPPLPSMSALEATRYAELPPPRMDGFPPPPSSAAGGGGAGDGVGSLPSAAPLPAAIAAAASPSNPALQFPAAAAAAPPPPVPSPPSSTNFPPAAAASVAGGAGGVSGLSGAAAMGGAGAAWGAAGAGGPSPAGGAPAEPAAVAGTSAPAPANEEEDDFGDFEGSPEEPRQQQQQQFMPPATPPEQGAGHNEDGDDFGDFSGAAATPAGGQVLSTAASSVATAETGFASSAAASAPTAAAAFGDGWDASTAWMTADGGGASAAGVSVAGGGDGAGKGGGVADMLETSLEESTVAEPPAHVADAQATSPLPEKTRDPVMVDRAAIAREKLSVFDAMADLDLAVGQEDWNDFADETTAPPRSPTPPPPASPPAAPSPSPSPSPSPLAPLPASPPDGVAPAAAAAGAPATATATATATAAVEAYAERAGPFDGPFPDAAEVGELSGPDAPSLEPSLWNGGDSSSGSGSPPVIASADLQPQEPWPALGQQGPPAPAGSVEFKPEASIPQAAAAAAVPAASEAESQEDDWGDFEDAMGHEDRSEAAGQGKAAPEDAGIPTPSAAASGGEGGKVVAPAGSDDGDDEEWGTFADAVAPAPAAGTEEVGASTAASASNSAGLPEAPEEEEADPFADIAPATPPQPPPRSPSAYRERVTSEVQEEGSGPSDEGRLGETSTSAAAAAAAAGAAATTMSSAGLPLSLRGLRDALAKRGRLEEAVEVQRRMELPPSASVELGAADGGGGRDGEDLDLDRWRAALDLPTRPTAEELAARVSAADAARGEIFRERFVRGRQPVEDEALAAGGGALALSTAVKRQRAARRAVFLASVLGAAAATGAAGKGGDGNAGAQREETARGGGGGGGGGVDAGGQQPELDFGLDAGAARSPPTLADWALMAAHVTRMAEAGIEVLEGRGAAGEGAGRAAVVDWPASPPASPPPPPLPPKTPPPLSVALNEDVTGADAAAVNDGTDASARTTEGEAAVRAEVAGSEKFQSFARGVREAVRVCRMLQAAAEDGCLEGVDGFASMERAWAELRRCAKEAAGGDDNTFSSVFGPDDGEAGEGGEELEPAGGGGGGGNGHPESGKTATPASSVKAIREACVERAPAGSALCAVSLQPLAVFGGGGGGGGGGGEGGARSSLPQGVVEYCGVRYLACAVNLWVNVLDRPPPPLAALEQ